MKKDESTHLKSQIVTLELEGLIYIIRGYKVMLDRDLSKLYGVETRVLIQAVKRNIERFPEDFMFQLNRDEAEPLRSQIVILNEKTASKRGRHIKYLPYAFTEQGVAMLSSVIRSPQAIALNIEIMRTFVKLRQTLLMEEEMTKELTELKSFLLKHSNKADREFRRIWSAIDQLSKPSPENKRQIGFDLNQ